MAIKFNKINIPSFVIVNNVVVSILPPITQNIMKARGKAGSYDFGNTVDDRTIEAEITIIAESKSDLRAKIRELATWLYYEEAKELIILDEPEKFYRAKVTGTSELEELLRYGQGTITFVCSDPYAYSTQAKLEVLDGVTAIENTGGLPTAPIMSMEFTQDVTDFAIVSNFEALYFGEPFDTETQTAKDLDKTIVNDACSSTSGWLGGVTTSNWSFTSPLVSNGYSFSVQDNNYGTGSKWHGGALVKSLGKEIQDFTIEARIQHIGRDVKQMGRIEIQLLDINGNQIGKMALADTVNNGIYPKFEARAGSNLSGQESYMFQNSWGERPTNFSEFDGVIRIERKGTVWNSYIAQIDSKGNHHTRMSKKHDFMSNKYGQKVASIQIAIGALGENPATTAMSVAHLTVIEHIQPSAPTETPYVFKSGDILTVDNSKGLILKNGEPYFSSLYPSSSFIKLDTGTNYIKFSSPVVKDGILTFREMWL